MKKKTVAAMLVMCMALSATGMWRITYEYKRNQNRDEHRMTGNKKILHPQIKKHLLRQSDWCLFLMFQNMLRLENIRD